MLLVVAAVTSDHYSDRIKTRSNDPSPAVRWRFDGRRLAHALVAGRQRLGWSTRQLAERAGISQSYVVALEKPRLRPAAGPTPTVDVVARLAAALGIGAHDLFATAISPDGRHALLVLEDHHHSPLDRARRAASSPVDRWVVAAPAAASADAAAPADHVISLRRPRPPAYDSALTARSLAAALGDLGDEIRDRQLGLVFADTSQVMSAVDDPNHILRFEQQWSEVVSTAAAAAGAHAAWNVCVYDLTAIRGLDDPVNAALQLLHSHDTVWAARGDSVSRGRPAARRLLRMLRPPDAVAGSWNAAVEQLLLQIPLAA
jgi:transcriptional regulator with XRE-family HTH domain